MATFSENQVRHLYVTDATHAITVKDNSKTGLIWLDVDGVSGKLRSDAFEPSKVMYAKVTAADKMQRKLGVKTVTIPAVNAGEEFYVRVSFRQFVGQTDSDTYVKYANCLVDTSDSSATVATKIAKLLEKSLNADTVKLVKAEVASEVITITEVEQPWVLGTMESVPVQFDVTLIKVGANNAVTDLTESAVATAATGAVVNNGKKTADLEYFLLGERGDQYRGIGFPNTVITAGLVDPTLAYTYLDIHYFADEAGTNNAKSEKDITVVSADPSKITALKEALVAKGITFLD